MIIPPRVTSATRRRPAHAESPDWRSFALGASALVVAAAFCIFVLTRLGS